MAQWTDPSRTFLIQQIRARQVIWDKDATNDNSHKAAKSEAFSEVASLMNQAFASSGSKYNGDDIRAQWKNLKDTFVRKLRYMNEGKYAYDTQKEPTWKFYRMLSFLDEKKTDGTEEGEASPPETMFDIQSLQREHGIDLVKNELHQYENSNQSAASSEEQMLSLFAKYENQKEPSPAPSDTPPSPSAPNLPQPVAECSSRSMDNKDASLSGDEEEEPRRKRPYYRRPQAPPPLATPPDEFDLFGQMVAAQIRRVTGEHSRGAGLRLQKALTDVLYENQMALIVVNTPPSMTSSMTSSSQFRNS